MVIAEDGISEDEVRRSLGDLLPLRVVWWGDRDYLEVIRALRPAVIVVIGANDELTRDCCRLLACLLSSGAPYSNQRLDDGSASWRSAFTLTPVGNRRLGAYYLIERPAGAVNWSGCSRD